MSWVRTTDGTFVQAGVVTDESALGKLWRWPTQWLPDGLAAVDSAGIWVVLASALFWAGTAWLAWLAWKGATR